jgi:hypothetical protein
MQPSKFVTICMGYSGLLITVSGALLFVFVDSMQLTVGGLSSLGVVAGGLLVINGSRQRWQRSRESQKVFAGLGIREYIAAALALVLTALFVAAVGLVV